MAEWDIETITLRAARDYADQLHFERGAGVDVARYEEDNARAKKEIAAVLAEVRANAIEEAIEAFHPFGGDDELDVVVYGVYERIREAIREYAARVRALSDDASPGGVA